MSRKKEPMRKIKEVLRLAHLHSLSERQIARGANMKKTTVHDYLLRFERAKLTWGDAQLMNDDELERLLFPPDEPVEEKKAHPDFPLIHKELRRKSMTLQLLWEEYRDEHPDGYVYSHFCMLYRHFAKTVDVSMRQAHVAGEKLFVDYSGVRASVVNPKTVEVKPAEIFVAVLGASNYTYAEATWTQNLADWTGSHARACSFLGGVPRLIVPDNLKSGVKKAWYYDPEINPTYQRLAEHYGVAILPARVARPKDKAKVEAGVLLVQRWILMKLRNRTFFSLAELNEAIAELLDQLNQHPFRKMPGSRLSLFEEMDKPALHSLPTQPFECEEWKQATVNIDYHVSFDDHLYSVPYRFVKETMSVRATASAVEIFHRGNRVAVHVRSYHKYQYTTVVEHMPSAHRWQAEWNPARLVEWGRQSGDHVAVVMDAIMKARAHPEQGYRACLGIMRMGSKVGNIRLDAACHRAVVIGRPSYACVRTILERGQENLALPSQNTGTAINHENVRGAAYYRQVQQEEQHAASSND